MSELTSLDIINLTASLASIILAVVAIVFSFMFFFASNKNEKETAVTVNKINNSTDTLNNLSMRMINKMTSALISLQPGSPNIKDIRKAGQLEKEDEGVPAPNKTQLEQFRVDNLITALYYAGLTNISTQHYLSPTIGGASDKQIVNLVDQSKSDFETLMSWLTNTVGFGTKVAKSPVNHMFNEAVSWGNEIKSSKEFLDSLESTEAPKTGQNKN